MRQIRITLAAAFLPLALAACGSSDETVAESAEQATGPRLTLKAEQVSDWKDVSAEVATEDQAQILARIPGILTSLTVKEGDFVRKGQVIGRVVDSQIGYQAAAIQAQVVQASAELKRVQYLYDNGVYAKARLEQAKAAADAAQAQYRAVTAVSGQGALVAPASGRVLMADVPQGAAVVPGMPVATVTAGPVVLKLELPESLAAQVHPGSAVMAELPEAGKVGGTISKIYPAVMGGQVRADASVGGLDSKLIGRRIPAQVEAGTRAALVVPADYVTTAFGMDTVWVVGKDGAAASVPVQTAPTVETGKIEILSGVQAGDVLVKKAAQ